MKVRVREWGCGVWTKGRRKCGVEEQKRPKKKAFGAFALQFKADELCLRTLTHTRISSGKQVRDQTTSQWEIPSKCTSTQAHTQMHSQSPVILHPTSALAFVCFGLLSVGMHSFV